MEPDEPDEFLVGSMTVELIKVTMEEAGILEYDCDAERPADPRLTLRTEGRMRYSSTLFTYAMSGDNDIDAVPDDRLLTAQPRDVVR
jgi:hypothetical protein